MSLALSSAQTRCALEVGDRRLSELLRGDDLVGRHRVLAADFLLTRGYGDRVRHAVDATLASRELPAADQATLRSLRWLALDGEHGIRASVAAPPPPSGPSCGGAQSAAQAWWLAVGGREIERARKLARQTLAVAPAPDAPLFPLARASGVLMVTDDADEAGSAWTRFLLAKGRYLLLAGEPMAAVALFEEVGRRMRASGWTNPALAPWRSNAALAYHRLDRDREARRLAAEELSGARCWGAAHAVGAAHLGVARISCGTARIESLERAVEALRRSSHRSHYARALLELAAERCGQGQRRVALGLAAEAGELGWSLGLGILVTEARGFGWRPGLGTDRPAFVPAARKAAER